MGGKPAGSDQEGAKPHMQRHGGGRERWRKSKTDVCGGPRPGHRGRVVARLSGRGTLVVAGLRHRRERCAAGNGSRSRADTTSARFAVTRPAAGIAGWHGLGTDPGLGELGNSQGNEKEDRQARPKNRAGRSEPPQRSDTGNLFHCVSSSPGTQASYPVLRRKQAST